MDAGLPQDFRVGPLPPGVHAPGTETDRSLYQTALGLESVFTQHLVDEMMKSAQSSEPSSAGDGIYRQMENETLNRALATGGGLGLAGSIYASMKQARS